MASSKVDKTCSSLELHTAKMYPGKHAATKAKSLFAELMNGHVLNGEGKVVIHNMICSRICHVFRPWKLVKAGNVSATGAFKTSTLKELHEVIDEHNEGVFPSPSPVSRARMLLDDHAIQLMYYRWKETKNGEVFTSILNKR